jgi:hypothetical protein
MFAFNRSATAVLVPLALLLAVVLWSNRTPAPDAPGKQGHDQTVAASLPSR